MIEILFIYCAFMYLFTGGVIGNAISKGAGSDCYFGMFVHFVLSPISTPVIMGMCFEESFN